MLPSISSGHNFGITAKPVCGISIVNKSVEVEEDRSVTCPSLPLISEGSFTSLVSRKSGKTLETEKERRNKVDEVSSSREYCDMQRGSLKMAHLQLNCDFKNADRGWYPQGLNARLANSSRPSHHPPTMGLHMMTTSQKLLLQQSLGQSLQNLQKRRNQPAGDKRGYLMTLGGQTTLNSRYRVPAATSLVSPSKEVQSVPSHAPESASVNLHRKAASKPAGLAIHAKCCSKHHKQNDNDHRATLKSRSSESLRTRKRVYKKGKNEGSAINQSSHGTTFSNKKRVMPTDRPPSKKVSTPSRIIVAASKKKDKRIINMLASDSSSSLQEEEKRVEKSTPKPTRQKLLKSPELKSKESILHKVKDDVKGNLEESMIYVENVVENRNADIGNEDIELMDEEHSVCDEEKVLIEKHHITEWDMQVSDTNPDHKPGSSLNNWDRLQPDSLDIRSEGSSTACDKQRSATPRLLKVTSEVPADSALAQVFQKLDTDCDGHISFNELKKSLPQHITRQQINYLKKIYDMACESTYFGLEEFTAVHQMCDLLAQSSSLVSNVLNNLNSSAMDSWISTFVELFRRADKNQSGVIDMQSFETVLATGINVQPNSLIIQKILGSQGKSKDDTFSGVELLAYIPYFVAVAPKDA